MPLHLTAVSVKSQPVAGRNDSVGFSAGLADFLSDGVTVAQRSLEPLVVVRIHVGQPIHRQCPGTHTQPRRRCTQWLQSSENKYSKSSFDRLRANPSSPSTSLVVCALRCCRSQIFSSTVPGAMRR